MAQGRQIGIRLANERKQVRKFAVGFLSVAFVLVMSNQAYATKPNPEHKVTICHATSSAKNPYVRITVDVASILGPHGHNGHPKDIIPPFNFGPGEVYAGKNWIGGYVTWENGCNIPEETTTTTQETTTTEPCWCETTTTQAATTTTTTTEGTSTTTVPNTTTSEATTTTAPTSTTGGTTTTGATTTTSQAPVVSQPTTPITPTVSAALPRTGGGGNLAVGGIAVTLLGAILALFARKRYA